METGRAEITLAERTSAVDSVMYNWTKFDLSNLKAVDMINFELVIPEGKAIPATVCMDDLMAQIESGKLANLSQKTPIVASQTTQKMSEWKKSQKILKNFPKKTGGKYKNQFFWARL